MRALRAACARVVFGTEGRALCSSSRRPGLSKLAILLAMLANELWKASLQRAIPRSARPSPRADVLRSEGGQQLPVRVRARTTCAVARGDRRGGMIAATLAAMRKATAVQQCCAALQHCCAALQPVALEALHAL